MGLTPASRKGEVVFGAPPRVHLLPTAERRRRALVRLQRSWITAVLAALAVMAVIVAVFIAMRVQANLGLGNAEEQKVDLQRQLAAYADVSALVSERDSLVSERAEALASDMDWGKPYRLLTPALPLGAKLTGFAAGAGGVATSRPGELGLKGTATVVSNKPIDQAIVLDQFAQVDHVLDVDMLGLQQADGVYTYSIYVAFDQGLYNPRFHAETVAAAASGENQ